MKFMHTANVQGVFDGVIPPSDGGLTEWELVAVVPTGRRLDEKGRIANMGDAEVVTFWKKRVDDA
jgi:hypothetical protein